jgi:Predicted bile acid beta-glucosidase
MQSEQIKKNTKTYTNQQHAFRALLGGIGTGNISLDATGRMCDFEIMNQPNKNTKMPYTFFSMWSQIGEEKSQAVVLEAAPTGISNKALGHASAEVYGLPRMTTSQVETNYPFYLYTLKKEGLPLQVQLEAYTPFIPLDAKDSGIPGFSMKYKVTNTADKVAKVAIAGSFYNFTGCKHYDGYDRVYADGNPYNEAFEKDGLTGVYMGNEGLDAGSLYYGSLALASSNANISMKPNWQDGGWCDGVEEFWQDFSEDGILNPDVSSDAVGSTIMANDMKRTMGSVSAMETIAPGETKEYVFYIGWNFPNRYGWWPDGHSNPYAKEKEHLIWTNYYSEQWKDAQEVLMYFHKNSEELYKNSKNFATALYGSTIGADVVESLVSSITVLRSTTCFRIGDGRFFAWEGCFDQAGSCPGTCTHVWNYAQTMAFLFPELEISARKTEFLQETDEEGNMAFRALRLLDGEAWEMFPAADGQLGCILRVYREWKLTGDDEFLKAVWDKVRQVLAYSLKHWDLDGDFVLDAQQHNTYDIEFYGISSLTNSFLYAALKACAEIASYLGEDAQAKEWKEMAEKGSEKMDKLLWNGSYYKQLISQEELKKYRYQYGDGCLSDQVLGQVFAHLYGLGYIFPKGHMEKTLLSIYQNNYRPVLGDHASVQRTYAYPDEGGLVLCSWPKGGRPEQPFVYSDEVWTGIEYHVATQLVYEGHTKEALQIIESLRARYDGNRRSPYNELECGNHYARSMAAWGMLVALSGYSFDLPHGKIAFDPKVSETEFSCFYSNGKSWGVYEQEKQEDGKVQAKITPLYGTLEGVQVNDGDCTIVE